MPLEIHPPLVSVIIPVYNGEAFLQDAVGSVIRQTYPSWEIIAVDDGSADRSRQILEGYSAAMPDKVRVIVTENGGVSQARNTALGHAAGKYVAFLDQDDLWMDEKLARQVEFLEGHPDTGFLYTGYKILDMKEHTTVTVAPAHQPEGDVFGPFLDTYPVALVTVMVRKEILDHMGELFDPGLRIAEEYELFLRVLHDHRAAYLSAPLAVYRVHGTNTFDPDLAADEYLIILKKFGQLYPGFFTRYRQYLVPLTGKVSSRLIHQGIASLDHVLVAEAFSMPAGQGPVFFLRLCGWFARQALVSAVHGMRRMVRG